MSDFLFWLFACLTAPVMTTEGRTCVFPFVYQGVAYDSCSNANHDRPWCAYNTNYVSGEWGNCLGMSILCIININYVSWERKGSKLQQAQNVVCRTLLLADNYEHIDIMHNELKLKLEIRRKFHLGNLCFKNVHCTSNTGIQDLFVKRESGGHLTTSTTECNVLVPLVKTVVGRKAISFRGLSFWNSLDRNLKIITKYPTFTR